MEEEIYETLRDLHKELEKLYEVHYLNMSPEQLNAIESLQGVLYMVESEFTDF